MAAQPPATAEPAGEEPAADAPPRTWIWPVLLVMSAAAVSQGFVRFTLGYVMPDMTRDLLGSYSAAGLLSAANLGGYLIGVLALTCAGHRFESTRLLRTGLALTTLGLAAVALAPSVPLLFVGMGAAGLCSALVWIPIPSVVAAHVPQRHRGLGFGLATAGVGISIAAIGPVVGLTQRVFGAGQWRPVWALEAAAAVLVLLLLLLLLKPVRPDPAKPPAPAARHAGIPGRGRLLVSYFLYGVSFVLYTTYLVVALREDLDFASADAARAFSLLGLASIAGGAVGGRASDRLGRRPVLAACMATAGLAALVVPLDWSGAVPAANLVYGLVMTSVGTVMVAYLGDVLTPDRMGTAFGSVTAALGLAQVVAPPIGGWLADATGSFSVVFHLACAAGVLAGIIAVFLPSTAAGRRR
ncbi:YbfB/YjiJ family MFS transporter [Thermobifida halotolerans]|uniref:YbfB/YjiJ family MFS transporter n=1 Tax=Thermobifida halotolerans TaxID=483545 RepID=A0A399FWK6_9ACTN|nr:YbfB/YjiJ family MFS transporter [Thermobifida halotolerans]UOE21245.1 YbfB/YjiJ family MFS transporter [Thermobifida halotolerans]